MPVMALERGKGSTCMRVWRGSLSFCCVGNVICATCLAHRTGRGTTATLRVAAPLPPGTPTHHTQKKRKIDAHQPTSTVSKNSSPPKKHIPSLKQAPFLPLSSDVFFVSHHNRLLTLLYACLASVRAHPLPGGKPPKSSRCWDCSCGRVRCFSRFSPTNTSGEITPPWWKD